jgi:TP901 family phage tail tape measure protein
MSEILGALGAGNLGNLFVRLQADSTEMVKGMNEAAEHLGKSSAGMLKSVKVMGTAVTGILVGVGVAAVEMAKEFEESFLQIQFRMRGSEQDAAKLGAAFREMSKNMSPGVNEINKVAAGALQLGISKENVVAFTKTMIDFGEVTQEALGQSSKDIVQFGKLFAVPQAELSRIASTVVKLGFNAGTSAREVLDMAAKIGSMTKGVGMSAQEVLGLSAALTKAGVEAGRGGVAIGGMVADMSKLVAAGDIGSEKLTMFAATAGMTSAKFVAAFKKDAVGALQSFFEGINQLQKRGGNVFELLERMGLDANLVSKEILKISASTDSLTNSLNMSAQEWKENAELTELAEMRDKMFHEQLMALWNRVKDFLLTVGEGLLPVLKTLNVMMLDLTKSAGEYGSAVDTANASSEGLLATLGAVVDVARYIQIGFLTAKMVIEMAFSGILTIAGLVVKAAVAMIEVPINTAIAAANLGIRTFNALGGHMKEITTKVSIDTSALDLLPKDFAAHAAADFAKIEELASKETFSKKLITAYGKVVAEVKEGNKEIKHDVEETFKPVIVLNEKLIKDQEAIARLMKGIKPLDIGGLGRDSNPLMEQAEKVADLKKSPEIAAAKAWLKEFEATKNQEIDIDKTTKDILLKQEHEYTEKLKALKHAETKIVLDSGQLIADSLASMAEDIGGKQSSAYKAMFAMSKAFAIAMAVVKIQQGIADAASKPWPANLAAMASVIAATATIVSSIKATQLTFAGGKAAGGSVSPGSTFLVGEKGPELFAPSQSGTIIPNHKLGGGSSPVRVVVNNYTDVQPRVTEKNEDQERVIEVMIRRVKNEISGDIRNGSGVVPSAMEKSFDLRRKGK